ncbi:MAG: aspartate carbamoyltransferase regulatory subunit [Thermoplasmata archaeon]
MKEVKVTPIKNGTVIDHIPAGMALKVLKILGITDESSGSTVSVAMRVTSKKRGLKDIVKVEDRELLEKEVDKIALVAPNATINIIRNYDVNQKHKVRLPEVAKGIVRCQNPNCITNLKEPVETEFIVISKNPVRLRCVYCERELENVLDAIT